MERYLIGNPVSQELSVKVRANCIDLEVVSIEIPLMTVSVFAC